MDAKGLVALWREALLAQKVLKGETKGYRHHPQLLRFQAVRNPAGTLATYLVTIQKEATKRRYRFDGTKIGGRRIRSQLPVTQGQLNYEWAHLLKKLKSRDPLRFDRQLNLTQIEPHPLFLKISGDVEDWEVRR